MIFSFGKKSASLLKDTNLFKLEFSVFGLVVTGPPSYENNTERPQSLEMALWQRRPQLVESALASPFTLDEQDAENLPIEKWAKIFVPFESMVFLKEGFSGSTGDEELKEIFDPVISDFLPPITDWTLKIEPSTNVLISSDLQLQCTFWESGREVHPRRIGPWLKYFDQASLLNETQWTLCQLAESFNSREDKSAETNFSALAQLYEKLNISTSCHVQLEAILEDTVIIAPSRMTVGWHTDSSSPDATQSAFPVFLNLPFEEQIYETEFEEAFRTEYFKYDKANSTYSLPALRLSDNTSPKRVRVLLPPDLQSASTVIRQTMRGLSAANARAMALNMDDHFEGVCSADVLALDISNYGPRVVGFDSLVFRPVLKVRTLDRVCLLDEGWDLLASDESQSFQTFIELEAYNGSGDKVTLTLSKDQSKLQAKAALIQDALDNNEPIVTIEDDNGNSVTCVPTTQLLSEFKKAAFARGKASSGGSSKEPSPDKGTNHNRHLSTISNEDQLLYEELSKHRHDSRTMLERFARPNSLVHLLPNGEPLTLAEYQQEGIAWLQTSFLSGKPGILLADDMGLGKTIQVLTFLAWVLETGWSNWWDPMVTSQWCKSPISNTLYPGQQFIVNPHPILIVVPKMLMDNWKSEIEKFFEKKGDIFSNFELLDSKEIKRYLLPHLKNGNDFKTGYPRLNVDYLQSNRLIVANYDTVKNYYHSFAKIRWSCLVMDESQEIKNPSTAITHAMSCIATNARFKITMTGTPIENDLMDLWSLFDVTAPGLLGSAKEFKQKYFIGEQASTSHGWEIEKLKETLGCKTNLKEANPTSYVLGRNKKDFLGSELPVLVDVLETEINSGWPDGVEVLNISCRFRYTTEEWQQQKAILEEIARESKRGKALKAVQYIKLFSEHPWLACRTEEPSDRVYDSKSLLESSSKFRWLVETLRMISKRSEKVLIFTRSIQMQAWINNLLKEYYDLDFQPINGAISGRKEAGSSLTTSILKKFDSYPGFAALVLSPEVAGVGLNITCANHIIHYGRWWNPAKEDQATCRAYRKGQMKDVYLYVPIGEGPEGQQSFDEKLDAMLRSKSLMRKDFLTPMGNLDLSDKDASILIPGYQNTDSIDAKAEGHEFEAIVADWLRGHGYQNVQVTKASHDWGADVLAVKDNCFYIVQCKRQLQSSEDVVNALNQAKTYYGNQADYSSYYLGRKMVIVVASKYEINESTRKFYESRNILVLKEDWS